MDLIGTPKSHFTRKVRLLLDHMGQPYNFIDMGDVSSMKVDVFADNPAMSVPVLRVKGETLIDADLIAAFCVREFDDRDRFEVLSTDMRVLNARALLNSAMSAEVRLVLAQRTGLDINNALYFDKARQVIRNVLDWGEANVDLFDTPSPTYLSFHLVSFWDHLHHYGLVSGVWPHIRRTVETLSGCPIFQRSSIC